MESSICVTVLNESENITNFINSILSQTLSAREIVIIDGGSSDHTPLVLKRLQKKHKEVVLIMKKGSRSKGRNLSIEKARSAIIAVTDAGCVVDKNWLRKISSPFKDKSVDIVAGFYQMTGDTSLQKAMAPFLGKMPDQFDENFLPSTRSIAFRKSAWKKIGGFPGGDSNTAEDTLFNYLAVKKGLKIVRVKDAVVYWKLPEKIGEFFNKISSYAEWDAEAKIFWHPTQKLNTHNIKVLTVFLRYAVGMYLVWVSYLYPLFCIKKTLIPVSVIISKNDNTKEAIPKRPK